MQLKLNEWKMICVERYNWFLKREEQISFFAVFNDKDVINLPNCFTNRVESWSSTRDPQHCIW
jgi:hypothetical protein